jgi:hypothetical protein
MRTIACSLSLRERAGVREAAKSKLDSGSASQSVEGNVSVCGFSLTPALSRREREQRP